MKNVHAEAQTATQKVVAGVKVSPGVLPELRLLVSSDNGASQLLHQDSNDADEQDEIDLVEKQSKNSVTSNGKVL